MTEREIFNSLVGKKIHLPDGDVEIVKRLPEKDMYNELYRRYPKNLKNVEDARELNSEVNRNMEELIENSSMKAADVEDADGKHSKQGVETFDTRHVKFYDEKKHTT
jgi:coenzyme F420-reducing hydrogenase alpha subunit